MTEFNLIERLRQWVSMPAPGVVTGIGDDAAVLTVEPGFELLASSDWLIGEVHFFITDPPALVGYKALAVNLSDMAAMGAIPRWALLNISAPAQELKWIEEVAAGVVELAEQEGVVLVGGDTSVGQHAVSVTMLGLVEQGRALLRSGAKPGDLVVVSGKTGEAAYALEAIRKGDEPPSEALHRLQQPRPRIALGRALVGKASACIDISDGLLADLGHIATASSCGATVKLNKLPTSSLLETLPAQRRWEMQLGGGDDYELCFTVPQDRMAELTHLSAQLNLELTVIGVMDEEPGVKCIDPAGRRWEPRRRGWEHFE
ncbi:MAG: thiamine-phosphate kinase [Xanthomonadales bacterium]|nr:thiamine-phosphate kinase [Xanthomonadales bacterium]NNL95859.1 thiamine-phosphate kinase [Xanthomonadales bacterium]